tara:strand:- start:54 stop:530 length:477 start_codon:yes stop_codon:yes gene_type:complete
MDIQNQKPSRNSRNYWIVAIVSVFLIIIGITFFFNFSSKSTTITPTEDQELILEPNSGEDFDRIENGIHMRTGFIEGDGLDLVIQNCTSCHSAKLVTQNRMSKEKWLATIRWMQESQNLWNLGVNEEPILNYLSTYYAPDSIGRRANLTNVEWYELKD